MTQAAQSPQEIMLLDLAQRIGKHADGRHAVRVHLSGLKPHNRRGHHVRIAGNLFETLLQRTDGRLFTLSNADLVAVMRSPSAEERAEVIGRLRYLFNDDPLAAEPPENDADPFCTWYDLAAEYPRFLAMAKHGVQVIERAQAERERGQREARREQDEITETINPQLLVKLSSQISSMDTTPLIRRQPVCALARASIPTPVFNELYVSVTALRRLIMPKVDLTANRWLFQYVTELLDQRVMRVLPDLEANLSLSTSININISTVLSPAFLEFDRRLRAMTRKTFVLELQPVDIFSDMAAFNFARDFARERGYRICIDHLSPLAFPMMDRQRLGFDFIKMVWTPEVEEDLTPERRRKLAVAVRAAGPTRVVLARCENARAIAFGHSIGITLFQGHHVDRVITTQQTARPKLQATG